MSDLSFPRRASSSTGNRGTMLRHSSMKGTNHPGKGSGDNQLDFTIVKGSPKGSTFSEPCVKAPVLVGIKRTRGDSEDLYASARTTGEVGFYTDLISTIVTGAKRLRINDRAADERDTELGLSLNSEKYEDQKPVLHASVTETLVIPETPFLFGLPEELIIGILQELTITDIMALRRTNKRLAYVTRARVLWIQRLYQLLDHLNFAKCPATFLPSQLSSDALEHVVLRTHIFDYKWLRSVPSHQNPIKSKLLSTNWSEPEDIRFPILMPGGRWLIAACDDGGSSNSSICLWDLDHGTLKWLPEAQMVAEGRISSLDTKMDRTGSFAFLAVLSVKTGVLPPAPFSNQVDVYKVIFKTNTDSSSFHQIDSLPLNRRGSEVQIYPQHGRVIVDLYDRVLLWDYAPINMCAWMPTSVKRRLFHRSAHAITHTHRYLLVADGDESQLRVFKLPPLLERPANLRNLPLFIVPAYLVRALPSFSVSLRFSADRLVDISAMLEGATKLLKLPATVQAAPNGTQVHVAPMGTHQEVQDRMRLCPERSARGFLFIDAASCDSYLFCSYPIHEITVTTGSPDTLCMTSMERGDAWEQTHSGLFASSESRRANNRLFLTPLQRGGRRDTVNSSALWVGVMGGVSSALTGDSNSPRQGARNVVLLQSPDYGSPIILSTIIPPTVDLGPGQSRITDIEQGVAKTVLRIPLDERVDTGTRRVRLEEASVDEISGKVCIVETTTVIDRATNQPQVRCGMRLLEYA